jgi:integrase
VSENLYQRGGVWWIRYNVDGRKVRQSLGTDSLKEAKRLKNEVLGARDAARSPRAKLGLAVEPIDVPEPRPVPTIAQVAKVWMESREGDPDLTEVSRKKTATALERHILPEFGPRIMSTIAREDVEAFIGKLRKKPGQKKDTKMSPDRVAYIFGQLRTLVRFSLRRRLYEGHDFTDLDKPPRKGPGRDVVLTADEARSLLAELPHGRWRTMATVALYAGLRWGEVNGLKWEDVDLESSPATMTVRRSYREGTLKTSASHETLPLHAELAADLRSWKKQATTAWLFPGKGKKTARTRAHETDYEVIVEAAKRAKIDKHITPHVFRHSMGTLLYESTQDPKAVQRLMRHGSFATTMKSYVHDRRDLGDKVNALPSLASRPKLRMV